MITPNKQWEVWVASHGCRHLITPERAYMAGLSEGGREPTNRSAMLHQAKTLANRMRKMLGDVECLTPAASGDVMDLDRDLRDWLQNLEAVL